MRGSLLKTEKRRGVERRADMGKNRPGGKPPRIRPKGSSDRGRRAWMP
ncbi:hypothetical protein JCM12178A_15560 [Salidesulfovibrio brasiliensis]